MHANANMLNELYSALDRGDHPTMAALYHPEAHFHDIAFDLRGKRLIHAMWHMIYDNGIETKIESVEADDKVGSASIVDRYDFEKDLAHGRAGRPVRNAIRSQFRFRDGLIIEHYDHSDPHAWGKAAMGGPKGFLAGRFRFLRSSVARGKLDNFIREHPDYW
ncbi:nuclear transport factor 2 family protein [Sphingobium sp. AS12]|uniref:nuclear transport factor 2 family protein n=1 Tax=Sphingobium sp. AS12 TaxID=2849495 RepID=UPI001C31DFC1|nr:nuclear transport factor 2 family protein [Sphingobium sp. AS12]MBV2150000.1 nuclear transport factor 2 family protein [Sphingobium sp. AS12]